MRQLILQEDVKTLHTYAPNSKSKHYMIFHIEKKLNGESTFISTNAENKELQSKLHTLYKIHSKWIVDLNVIHKILKLSEENLCDMKVTISDRKN